LETSPSPVSSVNQHWYNGIWVLVCKHLPERRYTSLVITVTMVNQTTVQKKASTSLNLNAELYKEARIEAIREGMTVSELVEEAIEAWIRERKKRA